MREQHLKKSDRYISLVRNKTFPPVFLASGSFHASCILINIK